MANGCEHNQKLHKTLNDATCTEVGIGTLQLTPNSKQSSEEGECHAI